MSLNKTAMRKFIIYTTIILATIAIGCFAQSKGETMPQSNKIEHLIKTWPASWMIGKAGEQGRDRLDSTYYLDTRIYEYSYDSKKEQQGVKDAVALILRAYDQDMPHCTGGFCSSNLLRVDNPIESKKLEMYYGENIAPFVVGGKGRNYAVLRFNSKQNPENGLWEEEKSYRTASGLLKISGVYNTMGYEFPNADKALRSTIDIAASEEELSTMVYVYNPICSASNILTNLQKYGSGEDAEALRESVLLELQERACELAENTLKKLRSFKKADGSFSYNVKGASKTSQGEAVCFGYNEGDVNATALVNGTVNAMFKIMGLTRPTPYGAEDAASFLSLIREADARKVSKLSVDDVTVIYDDADPVLGMPRFITASSKSTGATVDVRYDDGIDSSVLYVDSCYGEADGVSVKSPSLITEPETVTFSTDIFVQAKDDNETLTLLQIRLGDAFVINMEASGNTLVLKSAAGKTEALGITLRQGEWVNLRVEYSVEDASVTLYVDGRFATTSYNIYAGVTDAATVSIKSLQAASVEFRLDNTRICKE